MFIPKSDQACHDQARLKRITRILNPGYGNLTKEDIIAKVRAISVGFTNLNWTLVWKGNNYLARFLSVEGVGRTSIPCKGHKTGFTFYRWTGEEFAP